MVDEGETITVEKQLHGGGVLTPSALVLPTHSKTSWILFINAMQCLTILQQIGDFNSKSLILFVGDK